MASSSDVKMESEEAVDEGSFYDCLYGKKKDDDVEIISVSTAAKEEDVKEEDGKKLKLKGSNMDEFHSALKAAKEKGSVKVACDTELSDFSKLVDEGIKQLKEKVLAEMKASYGSVLSEGEVTTLSEFATGDNVLGRLHTLARVDSVTGQKLEDPKKSADCVRAIFAELTAASDTSTSCALTLAVVTVCMLLKAVRKEGTKAPSFWSPKYREAIEWFRKYEVPVDQKNYTHSSLRGTKDTVTRSGRLSIPDTKEAQETLAKHTFMLCDLNQPMTLVEMTTNHFPYVEDIDVEAGANEKSSGGLGAPPDDLVHDASDGWLFWRFRALILHRMFPQLNPLPLVLYTGSGYNSDKRCWKTSYHCIWPDLIVDRERAHVIRLATIDAFNDVIKQDPTGYQASLLKKLENVTPDSAGTTNSYDSLFDITGVRAGSLRMPYCDKVARNVPQRPYVGRPILPVGELHFYFKKSGDAPEDVKGVYVKYAAAPPSGFPDAMISAAKAEIERQQSETKSEVKEEKKPAGKGKFVQIGPESVPIRSGAWWVRRGTVRRPSSPERTPWLNPAPRPSWPDRKKEVGASGADRPLKRWGQTDREKTSEEIKEDMTKEARKIRRKFKHDAKRFKQEMDLRLCNPQEISDFLTASEKESGKRPMAVLAAEMFDSGNRSTLMEQPSKGEGQRHFLWKTPRLKGSVHFMLPDGEVRVQGSTEQQALLLDILSEFTEPWTGPIPEVRAPKGGKGRGRSDDALVDAYRSSRGDKRGRDDDYYDRDDRKRGRY
jgi:hypothetical protein